MIIKNKRTHKERFVTQEDWAKIIAHPQLRSNFTVIDRSDVMESIVINEKSAIIPEEILNFKKLKTKKPKTKKENL